MVTIGDLLGLLLPMMLVFLAWVLGTVNCHMQNQRVGREILDHLCAWGELRTVVRKVCELSSKDDKFTHGES